MTKQEYSKHHSDLCRGCITPVQIDNLLKALGGFEAFEEDPNVLDGYDEVDAESQERIRTALKEGHVPDEDWKGVCSC